MGLELMLERNETESLREKKKKPRRQNSKDL